MHHVYLSVTVTKLIRQIRKLHKRLQGTVSGTSVSVYRQALRKRYERCLQKLAALASPAVKAGTVAGSALLLSLSSQAQQTCSNYGVADSGNPIRRASLPVQNVINPAFVDIDGDGDLDCYEEQYGDLGPNFTHPAKMIFLRNKGTKEIPYYVQDTASGFDANLTVQLDYFPQDIDAPRFLDMDGDGDYDCIVGSYADYAFSSARLRYFENTGTATHPQFTERTGAANPFGFIGGYYGLGYNLADLDNDGDYDLLSSVLYYSFSFQNVGTPQNPQFKQVQREYNFFTHTIFFYDWNKDGLLDQFQYNEYYKNTGTRKKPKFTYAPSEGPQFPEGFFPGALVDINNDGYPDAFSNTGGFATTAPVATISAGAGNRLEAYPKDSALTYRWQRNGKPIAGAATDHYKPRQPGLYTVQIAGGCGTGVSTPYSYQTAQNTLGGESEAGSFIVSGTAKALLPTASVSAYPNPFTHSFTVQLSSGAELSKTSIRITDVQGRIVQVVKPASYTVHLGESLPKGVFIVQVLTEKESVYQGKVIKE
ncbi:MAG: T9SS type A sorting domain-containing protein [Williamsia sp.]|nr:T9SS type A sorting domain-containing protein [Williamsia sp.]